VWRSYRSPRPEVTRKSAFLGVETRNYNFGYALVRQRSVVDEALTRISHTTDGLRKVQAACDAC
jgi:hypothetical protein